MHSRVVAISLGGLFTALLVVGCDSGEFEDAPRAEAPDEPLVSPKEKRKGRRARGKRVPSGHPPVQSGSDKQGGAPSPSAGAGGRGGADLPVEWNAPEEWKKVKPSSRMRKAQYHIPGADGADGATLAVFHFPGSKGKIQANIKRWIGQFQTPSGQAPSEIAETETRTVNGATVHVVRMRGTYKGMGRSEPKQNHRLLGAIVETKSGPVFFKMVGPAPTVSAREEEFETFVGSLKMGRY